MRIIAVALMIGAIAGAAYAQSIGGMGGIVNIRGASISPAPPVTCTADGKTDWSNACDLGLLAAIGF